MNSPEIRQKFFDFFVRHGHEKVPSSSLIPAQDPTLLFANAGMNQFKDVFLGQEQRSYKRAVSIQKCVRAGGKHNDLDNVGFTKRHLTFFEMMGNFSFGDYFKKEAVSYAWEFVTNDLKIPSDRLHVSVFEKDDETYDLWHTLIGVPQERIHRLSAKDNFWQMGDTGPCGPCTEMYIDRGSHLGCKQPSCAPGCDCDRFLEFWNLVFMQFDRQADGTDKPLGKTGVDTGMGLERLCAIMQDKDSVFETDLFAPIIAKTERLTGKMYKDQDAAIKAAFHVLADHIRSSSFLISDGCAPSNEGRGYVLRKIIRRAALFAQKLTDKNIFPELSYVLVDTFGSLYPDLITNKDLIFKTLTSEIDKFALNLVRGRAILDHYLVEHQKDKIIDGSQAFKLYDTYGFPVELIVLLANEHGYTVDMPGFEKEMAKQREQSGIKAISEVPTVSLDPALSTEFTGYKELETASEISALIHNNTVVSSVEPGQECWVIVKKSPFFIVGGGQVPDQGWLTVGKERMPLQAVQFMGPAIAAHVKAATELVVGMPLLSTVDPVWRTNAMKNHTATHMLQAALIELFGKQIKQSGSLVHPDYLRFDFTYHEALNAEDIKRVEDLVNHKIRENIPVTIEYMTMKEAVGRGALAFFGDKYNPDQVRMVEIPHFSTELCGGTHVPATGMIGVFKITDSVSLSAGHRRIFAVTGPGALTLFQESFDVTKHLSQDFKVKREEVLDAVAKHKEQAKQLHATVKQLKKQLLQVHLGEWEQGIELVKGIPFLFLQVEDYSNEELKDITTRLLQRKAGFYCVVSSVGDKYLFVCAVAPEFSTQIDMKKFAAWLKDTQGLRSGGAGTTIQGGGTHIDKDLGILIQQWLVQ